MEQRTYVNCIELLQKELVPAYGCTEPVAIAYAAAKAREILGSVPERMIVSCSGNIIKNAKSVVVPATGGLKGIEAAAAIGIAGGDAGAGLEVLHQVNEFHRQQALSFLSKRMCRVKHLNTEEKLHIIVEAFTKEANSLVEIKQSHTNIVRMEKDGRPVLGLDGKGQYKYSDEEEKPEFLNFDTIYQFAQDVRISDVKEMLDRQISCNTDIAEYGMTHSCGANVGTTLVEMYGKDVKTLARALPAAGSDARMGGCEMPVVINSGSGNQGMTVSLPVITYAREMKASAEQLYRALCISNLTAIYQKSEIGRLSAFCGAVSAGAAAGAGIAYLLGGGVEQIASVVSNTLANVAGIICDGAKASCAAKIASSVGAAIMAVNLTMYGNSFCPGDGVVREDANATVKGVAAIAREGMRETDEVILGIMVENERRF